VASPRESTGKHAFLVGSGILLSRLIGLVRTKVFSHYFGQVSDAADAFNTAFRIPNFLQNLLGEGVLSASFIPVYARLLAQKDEKEAGRVAGAVCALLGLVVSVVVLVGVVAAPWITDVLASGYPAGKRDFTVHLVRILFPGAGLLVMSAWCLGVLNSHRKFFLSYTAPVAWNLVMIGALVVRGERSDESSLAIAYAWASVAGSALQAAVQVPAVLRLVHSLRVELDWRAPNVREVIGNFVPVFIGRGVVQISALVDQMMATWLGKGAVTALSNAQLLFMLPVGLFGMSISAAELPAMSGSLGDEREVAGALRARLNAGLRRIAVFVIPSVMAFLALGDVVAGVAFEGGKFRHADSRYVWGILVGSSVGLLATTLSRLYSSTYYALRDTRTPLRFAILRVALTIGMGYVCAFPLPRLLGIEERWGVAGLTASAGIAGWIEFALLRRALNRRIGATGIAASFTGRLWLSAAVAAAAAWGVKIAIGPHQPLLTGALVLTPYGIVYFAMTYLMRIEETAQTLRRVTRIFS